MQKTLVSIALFIQAAACAQTNSPITVAEVTRIVNVLASDSMQGRKAGTPGSDKAAQFIASEFKKAGLQPLQNGTYLQPFRMLQSNGTTASGTINGTTLPAQRLIVVGVQPSLDLTQTSGYKIEHIKEGENLFARANALVHQKENKIVLVDSGFSARFPRLAGFQQPVFIGAETTVSTTLFVLGGQVPQTYTFHVQQRLDTVNLYNVVGLLPGKTKKAEQVIFSAHYDHIGIGAPQAGDSIYNGANDDASGTTGVILLANHYKKSNNNARTLVFVAFTAEEIGGFGSQYFSKSLTADSVMTMFNLEMIGTESKWGRNSAYITGFDKTDMGTILQKNLQGSQFQFQPDPYPEQQLFYRSDNATLARLGVPAHTISTSKMDSEPNYHQASDEVKTLDLPNMTEIIKAIAASAKTIISGKDTPTRVKPESLE